MEVLKSCTNQTFSKSPNAAKIAEPFLTKVFPIEVVEFSIPFISYSLETQIRSKIFDGQVL